MLCSCVHAAAAAADALDQEQAEQGQRHMLTLAAIIAQSCSLITQYCCYCFVICTHSCRSRCPGSRASRAAATPHADPGCYCCSADRVASTHHACTDHQVQTGDAAYGAGVRLSSVFAVLLFLLCTLGGLRLTVACFSDTCSISHTHTHAHTDCHPSHSRP